MKTKANSTFRDWLADVSALWGCPASTLDADEWRPYYDAGYDRGEALERLKAGEPA